MGKTLFNSLRKVNDYKRFLFLFSFSSIFLKYKRSIIGPFWLTISVGILLIILNMIFGSTSQVGFIENEYIHYLCIGIIIWNLITISIGESSNIFINNKQLILQMDFPKTVLVVANLISNILLFFHLLLLIIIVIIFKPFSYNINLIAFLIGFILTIINLFWIKIILAYIACKYRDIAQIVTAVLQVSFFITPIFWKHSKLNLDNSIYSSISKFNPFKVFIDSIRDPLLYGTIDLFNLSYLLVFSILSYFFADLVVKKLDHEIVFWV